MIKFGTGGWRAIIADGFTKENIRLLTAGLCALMEKEGHAGAEICVGYDRRFLSKESAHWACEVLVGYGFRPYVINRSSPTPLIMFTVKRRNMPYGMAVTASHNPAKYNGYKAYGNDGCQVTEGMADGIMAEIEALDIFADVKKIPFEEALASGKAEYIGEETVNAFIDAVYGVSILGKPADNLKLVYTPLNGSGKMCVLRILDRIGVKDITVVPEQSEPDGNFPTCPYPNPEIREALQKGLDLCKTVKPDLLLATDPDCDRVGIAVNQHGEYVLMTGNEVGILLLNFIAQCKTELGTMPKDPVAVTTIVSTDMVNGIAKDYGIEIRRTLTGFKYIGDQIALLESEGHPERYLLGFEESYGYLSGGYVRDKDAVDASLLICEMFAYYKAQGVSLLDRLNALYAQYGYCLNTLHSYTFEGAAGFDRMQAIMQAFRGDIAAFGGKAVQAYQDYLHGLDGLPPSDVIKFHLADHCSVVVRPSGTEPKLKAYISVSAENRAQAEAAERQITADLEKLING